MKRSLAILCILLLASFTYAGVVAHWSFDSTSQGVYHDVSGNSFSAIGDLGIADGIRGKALDCVDSFEVVVENSAANFNSAQFSVEAWIYSDVELVTEPSFENYRQIFSFQTVNASLYGGYVLCVTSEGRLNFTLGNGSSWEGAEMSTPLQSKTWYYTVGTFDGEVLRLYLDGQLVASRTVQGSYEPSAYDARIGCQSLTGERVRTCFDGKLDEIVIHDAAMSETEIARRYSSVPEYKQNLLAYWSFDSTSTGLFYDNSGKGHHARGDLSTIEGIKGDALDCTGSGFELIVDSSAEHFNTDQFTVKAWIYSDVELVTVPSFENYRQIFSFQTVNTGLYGGYVLCFTSEGRLNWTVGTSGGWQGAEMTTPLQSKKWYHTVGTFDGEVLRLYLDGQLVASRTLAGTYNPSEHDARIGCQTLTDGRVRTWFDGKLDEMSVHGVALSEQEIAQRYNEMVPEVPQLDKGIVAHWSFDSTAQGIFYDVSGNGFHATGDLGVTDGVDGKALDCSGHDFQIAVDNSVESFNLDTFTIETWIYSDVDLVNVGSFYNYKKIFAFLSIGSNDYGGYSLHVVDNGTLEFSIGANGMWQVARSTTVLQPRTWYHVAGSYDGSEIKLYLDGEVVARKSFSGELTPSSHMARIGCELLVNGEVRNWFDGKIDEVILRNYAMTDSELLYRYVSSRPQEEAPFEINLGMKTHYADPGDTVCVPVYLTNFEDFSISACQFNINIDTGVVKLLDISKDSGIVKNWPLFGWNEEFENGIPVALGGVETPLKYGEGELVRCRFIVNSDAVTGDSSFVSLNNIEIDETNQIVVATSKSGKIVVKRPDVLYGDVTGNGVVNIFDAQKILDYIVGVLTDPQNEGCPNFTTEVADVSGNGMVTSYDAALVFQHSLGLLPEFPVQAALKLTKRASSASTAGAATLALALEKQSTNDGTMYSLVGSNLKGFVAGEFAIRYNPQVVSIDNVGLAKTIRGATVVTKPDPTSNMLKIAITTNDRINDNSEVSLLTLAFPPVQAEDPLSALELYTALVNEGKISTNIASATLVTDVVSRRVESGASLGNVSLKGKNLVITQNRDNRVAVRVWSLNGRCVLNRVYPRSSGQIRIGLGSFAPGTYIYRVDSGAKKASGRILIHR